MGNKGVQQRQQGQQGQQRLVRWVIALVGGDGFLDGLHTGLSFQVLARAVQAVLHSGLGKGLVCSYTGWIKSWIL
jgi:hypothetical protein